MIKDEHEHRKDIIEICQRMYRKGWIASSDGNVSIRLPRDRVLTTPTSLHKGFISERDLVVIDMEGRKISGRYHPSSEVRMHLESYKARPDIGAVVHAHPTYCVAFSLAGVSLAKCMLPEVVFTLGSIPTAPYSTPATEEVPDSIQGYIRDFDAIILERHGSLTVGKSVFDAYNLLERIEHVAEITHAARQLGKVTPLSGTQISRLKQVGKDLGLPPKKILERCDACRACPSGKFHSLPPAPDGQGCVSSSAGRTNAVPGKVPAAVPGVADTLLRVIREEISREIRQGA